MSYCDIVVDACPKSNVRKTLEHARKMAIEFDAKLWVVAYAWPLDSDMKILAGNALTALQKEREMEDVLQAVRNTFNNVIGDDMVEAEWCSGVAEPTSALRDHLFAADLLITSRSESTACVSPDLGELALQCGTPILRLGKCIAACFFPHALVAWKDCSQARRALHDALPILKQSESVTIVGIGDEVSSGSLEAINEHLRRHKVNSHHVHLPQSQHGVCFDLINQAEHHGASLIVSGVFGHSRFKERVLGGVTKEMLSTTEISWLMAH